MSRKLLALLQDGRTYRAGASLFYPTVMTLLFGITGTAINVLASILIWRPWRGFETTPALIAILIATFLIFPILYFILGGRYGVVRAMFALYRIARPSVIELVIETRKSGATPLVEPDAPRAMKRLVRLIVRIAGTGDRLTDAIERDQPDHEVVGAAVDDIVASRLVEPARNALIILAVINAIVLLGLAFAVTRPASV